MGTSFDVGIPDDLIGIIPRAARHLFEGIKERREKAENDGKPLPEIKVTAQFLEVYFYFSYYLLMGILLVHIYLIFWYPKC